MRQWDMWDFFSIRVAENPKIVFPYLWFGMVSMLASIQAIRAFVGGTVGLEIHILSRPSLEKYNYTN